MLIGRESGVSTFSEAIDPGDLCLQYYDALTDSRSRKYVLFSNVNSS